PESIVVEQGDGKRAPSAAPRVHADRSDGVVDTAPSEPEHQSGYEQSANGTHDYRRERCDVGAAGRHRHESPQRTVEREADIWLACQLPTAKHGGRRASTRRNVRVEGD